MIRRKLTDGWLIFTQPDHARLAGELAQRWGNDDFARPEPYDDVLLAVAEHDNGWRELDAEPKFNSENGLPYNFAEWPLTKHFPIWQRAEKRFLERSPYASALISRHGSTLFRSLADEELDPMLVHPFFAQKTWRAMGDKLSESDREQVLAFVKERETFQMATLEGWASQTGKVELTQPENLNANLRMVQVCDALSLYTVLEAPQEKLLENITCADWKDLVALTLSPVSENEAILDPYPFDTSPVRVEIVGRKIPTGPFASEEDLAAAWQAGTPVTHSFTFLAKE